MNITKGIRKFRQPQDIHICLGPGSKKTVLVSTRNGVTKVTRISKKTAEELIASGMSYEG